MIDVHVWARRIEAVLGREPESVQEALEGLRQLLRRDKVAKQEFYQAARKGERFERFSRKDRVALMVWAALKEALEKTRQHFSHEHETSSTLVVRKDDSVREGVRGARPKSVGTWRGPDRVYPVYPWDTRRGMTGKWLAEPDQRVAEAKEAVERFLASGEEVYALSHLERAAELANPHFSEDLVSEETMTRLEKAGILADPSDLVEMTSLVDSLATREEKFKEGILGASFTRTPEGAALVETLQGHWMVGEVGEHLARLAKAKALPPEEARRLFDLLQEIAAIRLLKAELHRAGFAPVRAVAYRDSSGEVVYVAPVYGARR